MWEGLECWQGETQSMVRHRGLRGAPNFIPGEFFLHKHSMPWLKLGLEISSGWEGWGGRRRGGIDRCVQASSKQPDQVSLCCEPQAGCPSSSCSLSLWLEEGTDWRVCVVFMPISALIFHDAKPIYWLFWTRKIERGCKESWVPFWLRFVHKRSKMSFLIAIQEEEFLFGPLSNWSVQGRTVASSWQTRELSNFSS